MNTIPKTDHIVLMTTTVVAWLAASIVLAVVVTHQTTPQGWWSVAFVDADGPSYTMAITNHTDLPDFVYTVMDDDDTTSHATSVTIAHGTTQHVTPTVPPDAAGPITIIVHHGKEKFTLKK